MITPNIENYARQQSHSLPRLVKPEELAEALKGEKIMAHIATQHTQRTEQ